MARNRHLHPPLVCTRTSHHNHAQMASCHPTPRDTSDITGLRVAGMATRRRWHRAADTSSYASAAVRRAAGAPALLVRRAGVPDQAVDTPGTSAQRVRSVARRSVQETAANRRSGSDSTAAAAARLRRQLRRRRRRRRRRAFAKPRSHQGGEQRQFEVTGTYTQACEQGRRRGVERRCVDTEPELTSVSSDHGEAGACHQRRQRSRRGDSSSGCS